MEPNYRGAYVHVSDKICILLIVRAIKILKGYTDMNLFFFMDYK